MDHATQSAALWQNVVAIAVALGAAAWLLRQAIGKKKRPEGTCANCSAHAAPAERPVHLSTAKRPERTSSPVSILKK